MAQQRRYARVALPLAVDQLFTYEVPVELQPRVAPGVRAVVPFRNKPQTGYVVEVLDETDFDDPKPVREAPDADPVLSLEMLQLCKWMAEYYCCSWGEALHCAVPAGLTRRTRMVYRLVPEQLNAGRFSETQKKVVAHLYKHGPSSEGQLKKAVDASGIPNALKLLTRRGILIAEPAPSKDGVGMRTETYVSIVQDAVPDEATLEKLQRRAPKQAAVYLDLLHTPREAPVSALYAKHGATSAIVKGLAEKGLVTLTEHELYRTPHVQSDERAAVKHPLNDEQHAAYETITGALAINEFATFLLEGITGSGKTEVYLQAIESVLAQGRDAILLVPEISLTPQTVGRFKARFQEAIAVLHSGLAPGERYDEWRRAQRGEVRIVVGARSAVFAPLKNVGMIIVDEEHDTSYKQTETPRYHGRDVAIMRAHSAKAVCVLGSATPSVESYYKSTTGKYTRLFLSRRATTAQLPGIRLIDMRSEAREHGGAVILAPTMEDAIHERVANNEQVILLLNRRGFAPFVLCPQCSWTAMCDDCMVTMTYHAQGSNLTCHYCNARRDVPAVCDECGFHQLVYLGTGTQKIEDLLQRTFPTARIERMDADTTSTKGAHGKILARFSAGEIDILVGTQMLAKGHDYPGVTLVGVVSADTALAIPDFRSAELTYQLITQVAGRAGRGEKPGEVFVQTFRPNHYAIQAALAHDYRVFYEQEIAHRERAGYPPFRRMVNFHVESIDPALAEKHMAAAHRCVREQRQTLGFNEVESMGPAPATIRRMKKYYRWNLALLAPSSQRLNTLARAARAAYDQTAAHKDVNLKIDFDPYGVF